MATLLFLVVLFIAFVVLEFTVSAAKLKHLLAAIFTILVVILVLYFIVLGFSTGIGYACPVSLRQGISSNVVYRHIATIDGSKDKYHLFEEPNGKARLFTCAPGDNITSQTHYATAITTIENNEEKVVFRTLNDNSSYYRNK